ncbi:MAG: stage II sporulation protein D [Acutalibacteraceae bacterium]
MIVLRKEILYCFSIGLSMLILPCICFGANRMNFETAPDEKSITKTTVSKTESRYSSTENTAVSQNTYDSFKILDTSTGTVVTVPDKEFCYGAVVAEMPPSFEIEALKAQCVAAYTYFCRERENSRQNPSEDLKGADFKADLSEGQYYISQETLKEKWGKLYETSFEKIKTAVDEVFGKVLTYEDELIICAYHAVSGGMTEACADVFSVDLPYLTAVASPYDCNAPSYQTTETFTAEELKDIFQSYDSGIDFSENPKDWLIIKNRTNSGTVTEIQVGNKILDGQKIRTLLSLRSANFEVEYNENEFVFTVRGYGHGVGMSQYGAEYMAQQGADYEEILKHYFTGVTISTI